MLAKYYRAKARTFEALAVVSSEDDMDNDSWSCRDLHAARLHEAETAWALWSKYRVYNERLTWVGQSIRYGRFVCADADRLTWVERWEMWTREKEESQSHKVGLC